MDDRTERCLHCGATVTVGRFCTNCGAQLGTEPTNPRIWPSSTDTAERVYDAPEPAYATGVAPTAPPAYAATPEPAHLAPAPQRRGPGPGPGLWIGVAVALVAVLVLGGFLLLNGSGGGGEDATSSEPQILPSTAATESAKASTSPSPSATTSSQAVTVTGPPTNVAGFSQATAPSHAPAGVDFAGQPVTYVAPNMVDGRNDTCWRTPGDATGMVLTFRLDQPTRVTRVGLVNGYSKIAYSHGRPYDWYLGNRRVDSVDWIFDDGTTVSQQFGKNRALQQMAVKPVTTSVVRVKITAVSPPGKGRAARNDTAISEVFLLGRTGA
ncbi:MAG TPA: discoidin domain-containing protein [Nocardioides sp.]|jgi:hypothetical protein|nr:discoidin domain-containing protein [Nocardioides sp.]